MPFFPQKILKDSNFFCKSDENAPVIYNSKGRKIDFWCKFGQSVILLYLYALQHTLVFNIYS